MKTLIIVAVILVSGCANTHPYIEYEHYSKGFNDDLFVDSDHSSAAVAGARYRKKGYYFDFGLGSRLSGAIDGKDPFTRTRIGKEW